MRHVHPPVYLLGSLLAQAALHAWLPLARIIPREPAIWTGSLVMLAALALFVFSASFFFRRQTTIVPFEESNTLIVEGSYRISRNPIYLGMVIFLCGFACLGGSLSAWLVPPLFVFIISKRFIRHEERMLEERFGDAYRHYKTRVRRWI